MDEYTVLNDPRRRDSMRKQVTRTEAMKLIGKNIVAVKKDGTRVTGKLLKVSGNKLVLKRLGGKKYVPRPSCLWYYLICWPLRPYLMLMAKARDSDQGMVQVRNLIVARVRPWLWTRTGLRPRPRIWSLWSRTETAWIFLKATRVFFPFRNSD